MSYTLPNGKIVRSLPEQVSELVKIYEQGLYVHCVTMSGDSEQGIATTLIINRDSSKFTLETLKEFLISNKFDFDHGDGYPASGCDHNWAPVNSVIIEEGYIKVYSGDYAGGSTEDIIDAVYDNVLRIF